MAPPKRIDLDNGTYLRWLTVGDASAVAHAVGDSLEHLKPWMPWADVRSTEVKMQRTRLRNLPHQRERGEEWQYGLFDDVDHAFLGAFGLMTRRGPRTLEIGYWLHVARGGHGYATAAARALTEAGMAVDDIDRMIIVCDEANTRSAAIPQRLGYSLDRVERRPPEAASETGRMQIWVLDRADRPATR